ncbi:MAG: peptidoglycan DD-metalloendopeptidase family protein [Acidobacteria bacterium]|nr:peptidoglycan DD-metalloendopeptidase family protein [Acidobacteriota bacterium]
MRRRRALVLAVPLAALVLAVALAGVELARPGMLGWPVEHATAQQLPARVVTEAQNRRVAERLRALQREADELAAQSRTLLGELKRLELQRDTKTEQLRRIESNLTDVREQLDHNAAQIARFEARAAIEEPDLTARLVELYKLGSAKYVRLLFSVDNLRKLGRAYRTTAALAHQDRLQVSRRHETLQSLSAARTTLVEQQQKLQTLQIDVEAARLALTKAVAAHNDLLRQIDSRRDLNAQLAGELMGVQQKLQEALRTMGAKPGGVERVKLSIRPFRGALNWPVQGQVVTRFGLQRTGRFGTTIVRNGIEITAPLGEAVVAVHEGTVGFADVFAGFGNLVIVDHGDRAYSLYGHLETMAVKAQDRVQTNQRVGTVGTGPDGAPALYFELRIDGKPIDPLQWLKR